MSSQALLSAERLEVNYGAKKILRGVSLRLGHGETLAIVGRSGCGKSTLLRTLCALQRAAAGNVFIEDQKVIAAGVPLFEESEIRRHISMVIQGPSLLPHLTALNNIALALRRVAGLPKREARETAFKVASELGLEKVVNSFPEELSGGEMQRVQLARAVVLKPKVLLLDEVTSSLDPQTIDEVVTALRSLRSRGTSSIAGLILVTHLLWFAYEFADRIAFMHQGVIGEEGDARTFAASALKEETKKFLGI